MSAQIEEIPLEDLNPWRQNARTHSRKQIAQIARSIERFGFTNPVLIDEKNNILAGHGRVRAAAGLGMETVPCLRFNHMSAAEKQAYVIADNKLALNAGWDKETLAIELQALVDLDFDMELTGFSMSEIDLVIEEAHDSAADGREAPEDDIPPLQDKAVARKGDRWLLGRHRLVCGDARNRADYDLLLKGEEANLIFTDPPYNVAIDGNVCGKGRIRHREFAMASGEMTEEAYTAFLGECLGAAAGVCSDGAIAFVCMDWRHMGELLAAGKPVFSELKNVCVWNKSNAGMGSFYRSKHELVFAFKVGTGPHINNFGLGKSGRHRSNVWDYPGGSSFGSERDAALAMHPTVKPAALVGDAIRDCSKRGQIVLDPFGGSGTTLIAAAKTGRAARLIEYDALYCDTIIRRFETYTGKPALLASTGETFEDVAIDRNEAHAGEPHDA